MIGRLARTVAELHPLQIAWRAPHALVARALRGVPASMAPRVRTAWPEPVEALRRLAQAERERGAARLARLPAGSRLRAYESCYGLELGGDAGAGASASAGRDAPHADWTSRVALEPYPASVRARRLAVAARCGRPGLAAELARAARAVLAQPELHLLGNHVLENGFGLACAGAAAEGPEADLWWAAGAGLLGWQLPEQFLADGGHVERSASYHAALTAALLEAIELARASGRSVPALWRAVAERALGWMEAVRAPDGTYPLFNDAALDAAPGLADVLALGSALGLSPANVADVESAGGFRLTRLEATGWVRLDGGDASAVFDAGPDASGWQPGHAHADGLAFELWLGGTRAIVDFGVATYEAGEARDRTRATRSHNTVELDGRDSCEVWGAFRLGRRGRGRVLGSGVTAEGLRLELDHDGYAWLPGGPRHVRRVALGPGRLIVTDRIGHAGARAGEGRFVSRLRLDAEAAARGPVLRVLGVPGPPSREDGVWHREHGQARAATVFAQGAPAADDRGVVWHVEW